MRLKNTILIAALLTPAISSASNLNIINETEHTLSFSHLNTCSNDIGSIQPKSTKVISGAIFEELCKDKTSYCSVTVYKETNCQGALAATLTLNTTDGVTGVYPHPQSDLSLYGDGFNIYFK